MIPAFEGGMIVPKAAQVWAWGVFVAAWAQMGWVDWKQQKIRNRYLVFWLKLVAAAWAALALQSAAGAMGWTGVYLVPAYWTALLGHAAFSAAAAYALWWLRIWPAGDVKLFALLALCYPLTRIPGDFRSGMVFLEVLINVFVPAAALLFLTAGEYLWRTRFAHLRAHAAGLAAHQARSLRGGLGDGLRALAAACGDRGAETAKAAVEEIRAFLRAYRDPRKLAVDGASWIAMMALMSTISYYLSNVIRSNVLKTVVCFALMFTWSRFCALIGTGRAMALAIAACAALLRLYPDFSLPDLAVIFGHITVFSLCIFLGIQLAFKIVAGRTGAVFAPFLFMLPGLIPWGQILGWLWSGVSSAASALYLPPPPAWTHGAASPFAGLWLWAFMGLFFGLALVFVRIWDAESYQSVPADRIEPFMNPGPDLVKRIEEDEEFAEEHFDTIYADGLTREQADALKAWCAREGIATVPLAPTISFANWIFLGYLLTRVLDGHVLRFLY